MATLFELKEHLEHGGKIRRAGWDKGDYIFLADNDDLVDENEYYFNDKQLLLDDWEVYEEPFVIDDTALYWTRSGRLAFVGTIEKSALYPIKGFIEGDKNITCWAKNGKNWDSENDADDIVSKKEN